VQLDAVSESSGAFTPLHLLLPLVEQQSADEPYCTGDSEQHWTDDLRVRRTQTPTCLDGHLPLALAVGVHEQLTFENSVQSLSKNVVLERTMGH